MLAHVGASLVLELLVKLGPSRVRGGSLEAEALLSDMAWGTMRAASGKEVYERRYGATSPTGGGSSGGGASSPAGPEVQAAVSKPEALDHDWVFITLGGLLITNAFLMGAIYFTIRTFTTSLEHIEIIPTYSIALLVS